MLPNFFFLTTVTNFSFSSPVRSCVTLRMFTSDTFGLSNLFRGYFLLLRFSALLLQLEALQKKMRREPSFLRRIFCRFSSESLALRAVSDLKLYLPRRWRRSKEKLPRGEGDLREMGVTSLSFSTSNRAYISFSFYYQTFRIYLCRCRCRDYYPC